VNAETAGRSHTLEADPSEARDGSDPQDWTSAAACKGRTHLFFGSAGERPERRVRREARARKVCGSCAALWPCRSSARANRENGFWGGESEEERAAAGYPPRSISRRSVHAASVTVGETPVQIRATAC
jgi:WhiB family transcriptional regulator, redox-sensing transcriptional regulator